MNIPYKRILVTLDGSTLAAQALPHAEALARQADAELILLRVVPYLNMELVVVDDLPLGWNNLDQQQVIVDAAMQELQGWVRTLKLPRASANVKLGEPADEIIDYVRTYAIDLLVMSTHGRTGLQRWLMGSIANKVVASASCPVLLIRPS